MTTKTGRSARAVTHAVGKAEQRFSVLLATKLAGLDFSMVWDVLWSVVKEIVMYVGGGAIFFGAVGGIGGAFFAGAGAVPGAIGGALFGSKVGAEIMMWMGLGSLVKCIGTAIPEMCSHLAEGFATAWAAGQLPDNARGEYPGMIERASISFAQGKLLLVVALLSAIVVYFTKGQLSRSMLLAEISASKLGPKFATWVAANEAKLMAMPALRSKLPAAADQAGAKAGAGVKPGAAPEPVAAKPAKPAEAPPKNGKGEKVCPVCPNILVGPPVHPIFGSKILLGESDLDFSLPAPLPLPWQRTYSSDAARVGWLGQGWSTPISEALLVSADEVMVLDAYERAVTFSLPEIGESIYSPYESVTLSRTGPRTFELVDENLLRRQFALPANGRDIANLVGLVDANGNTISILHNRAQLPERINDSAGRVFTLVFGEHQGQPRLRSVALVRESGDGDSGMLATQSDVLVYYDYDEAGDLAQVRNGAGQLKRQFLYRQHMLVQHGEPDGLVSCYEYDQDAPSGKVLHNWTNGGHAWRFDYRQHETIVTDNLGRRQHYRFDHERRLIGLVDAAGGVTLRTLDRFGNLLALTDPAGRVTRYRYDERSRVVRIEGGGSASGIVYDTRFDKPALITDALGVTTALRYDDHGNLTSITDGLGQRTSYQYNNDGLPVRITDAAGGVKKLSYNAAGQPISQTDCAGKLTRFDYDDSGKLRQVTDANDNVSAYDYDDGGRLLATRQADGTEEHYEYDEFGRICAHIAGGNRTSYVLDSDGRPLQRIDARGGVLQYQYDAARRMAALVNENGETHSFAYDAMDRLTEEIGFDGCLTRYRYDASGQIAAKEEHGSGARSELTHIETSFLRDTAGRLIEKITSRVTGPAQAEQMRERYGYDLAGRMTHAANADAAIVLKYDAVGQLVAEQTTSAGHTSAMRHAYDELGNRVQTVLPDGRVLNHLFYGSGHLHQINLDGEVVSDIERDSAHRPVSRSQGALTSHFRYDPVGRLLSQVAANGSTPALARRYEYDAGGNLVVLDDSRNGRSTFEYDVIGRILSATQPQLGERFAFDPAHNLLNAGAEGSGRVEGNRLRVFEDKRFDYDAHGNLIEKRVGRHTHMQFTWNGAHQLVKSTVTRNAGQEGDSAQTVKYAYDPFGRRIAKRDAFGTTRFAWDGNRLLSETRGTHCRTYIYEPDSFVPLAQIDSAPENGGAAAQVHYLHTDHLGTPREVSDAGGRVTWAATYKAWGNVLRIEAPEVEDEVQAGQRSQQALAQAQPIRFQGQYHDVETGLHYNRFRYYDPDVGRFVSQDPIGLAGGHNAMAYAPNPTGWIDPLGLATCGPCPKGTGVVARSVQGAANRVLEWDKFGNEIVYRGMKAKHYNALVARGIITGTGETSTSPAIWYASRYAQEEGEVLVRFAMKPGTSDKLLAIAVAADDDVTRLAFPDLPVLRPGVRWGESYARIKVEGDQVTTALGAKGGRAIKIFEENIVQFERIAPDKTSLIY
ncbi:DUF6861 domain-containing protein [Massilia rubra]|nr:RHS repeat-associated core domain-containing protein [Massilia rubra]